MANKEELDIQEYSDITTVNTELEPHLFNSIENDLNYHIDFFGNSVKSITVVGDYKTVIHHTFHETDGMNDVRVMNHLIRELKESSIRANKAIIEINNMVLLHDCGEQLPLNTIMDNIEDMSGVLMSRVQTINTVVGTGQVTLHIEYTLTDETLNTTEVDVTYHFKITETHGVGKKYLIDIESVVRTDKDEVSTFLPQ